MCSKLPIKRTGERRFAPLWHYLPILNTSNVLFLSFKLSLYFDFKDFREENSFVFWESNGPENYLVQLLHTDYQEWRFLWEFHYKHVLPFTKEILHKKRPYFTRDSSTFKRKCKTESKIIKTESNCQKWLIFNYQMSD